jgi:hypothetical protein
MEAHVTTAELLDALRTAQRDRANGPDGDGFTVQELSDEWNLSTGRVRAMMRPLLKAGQLCVSRKMSMAMDGVRRPVPAYTLTAAPAPAKARRGR